MQLGAVGLDWSLNAREKKVLEKRDAVWQLKVAKKRWISKAKPACEAG